MPTPMISKQQVLAALTTATQTRHDQGREGLAGLSMDQLATQAGGSWRGLSRDPLATQAGVSRATLYRLFGSHQHLLHELGLAPPPTVRTRILDTALELVGRHGLAELSM